MSHDVLLRLQNGSAVERSSVPQLALREFRELVIGAPRASRRVAALFGCPVAAGGVELFAVLALDREGLLEVGSTLVDRSGYPSMTPDCPQVHLFEREIAEQCNLVPESHPWFKPLRRESPRAADFYRIEGEEVHEVAVGPIHAGVIEPGHFRFQCHGEQVFHLEISLGYQHRGIERALVGGPNKRSIHYMETLAGDTTVGHTLAYCQTFEALADSHASARGHVLRAVGLELERLANHTGDLGAMANDIGFLPTASYCGRLRGDFLNLTAAVCGSRFGRGLVRPGGVGFNVNEKRAASMVERLDAAQHDVAQATKILWNSSSVQARFEDTGPLTSETARDLGVVGLAARASGLRRDVRKSHPAGIFRFAHIPLSTWHTGDVFARAYVRWLEIEHSARFVREQLRHLPGDVARASVEAPRPNRFCVSLVEGWRGEICHVGITDARGRFATYKIVDPSFHNWPAVAMALRDQQISDFPLCNKSFNLSYCGHDL